jgi:hypothetical protein
MVLGSRFRDAQDPWALSNSAEVGASSVPSSASPALSLAPFGLLPGDGSEEGLLPGDGSEEEGALPGDESEERPLSGNESEEGPLAGVESEGEGALAGDGSEEEGALAGDGSEEGPLAGVESEEEGALAGVEPALPEACDALSARRAARTRSTLLASNGTAAPM